MPRPRKWRKVCCLPENNLYGTLNSANQEEALKIEGGDYMLCDGLESSCGCGGCHRHRFGNQFDHDNNKG